MTRFKIAAALGLMIGLLAAAPASAWERGNVDVLAVLPESSWRAEQRRRPHGRTRRQHLRTDVRLQHHRARSQANAVLFVISPNGKLVRQVTIANSSPHMLGLAFNPVTTPVGPRLRGRKCLQVDPVTGASKVLMRPDRQFRPQRADLRRVRKRLCVGFLQRRDLENPAPAAALQRSGAAVRCSGRERVLRRRSAPMASSSTMTGTILFVANTAYHQIIQIPVNPDGSAGAASIFITGINAPDGIMVDRDDNFGFAPIRKTRSSSLTRPGK